MITLQQNYALNVARSRALTKQGYLLKGLFWNDGASIGSAKVSIIFEQVQCLNITEVTV